MNGYPMRMEHTRVGLLACVMVCKLGKLTFLSEFDSHWMPRSYGFVPHLSKRKNLSKLLLVIYTYKLSTVVKGNPKAPISLATTPGCRGGCYSFP